MVAWQVGPLYDGRARCSVHGKGVLSSRGPHIMADVMSGPLAQARFYQGQLASMGGGLGDRLPAGRRGACPRDTAWASRSVTCLPMRDH